MGGANTTPREFIFDGLKKILGDGGLAMRDGFIASPPQRDYAQRWAEGICRSIEARKGNPASPGSLVLSAADTGTGKTIGYGVPLMLRAAMGVKVAISTYTHALQQQFIGRPGRPGDLVRIANWIRELGYGDLRIARRVGQQAFVSNSAVMALIDRMRLEREDLGLTALDLRELDQLVEFSMEANEGRNSGLIEDLREEYGGELPLGITAANICLSADSDDDDWRAYNEHIEKAENSDVLLVSHAYLASCTAYRRGQLLQGSDIDSLVIDEGDRLLDVAESAFRFDTSLRRMRAALQSLGTASAQRAGQSMQALLEAATNANHAGGRAVATSTLSPKVADTLLKAAETATKHLAEVLATPSNASRINAETKRTIEEGLFSLQRFVQTQQDESEGGFYMSAISYSPLRSLPSISVMPRSPGRILAKLWRSKIEDERGVPAPIKSVMITSATLGNAGNFNSARERFRSVAAELGVDLNGQADNQRPEIDLWAAFEPEKFGKIRFVIADPSVNAPVSGVDDTERAVLDEGWTRYAAQMIAKAHQTGGRTLVLCNSYHDAHVLAQILVTAGMKVLQQVRGQSTADMEAAFLADPASIWLSPTAWEGLNLPGAISNLVITRLPFGSIDETTKAILLSYGKLTDQAAQKIVVGRMINQTKRKMRQGIGRPIRSKADRAVIWIADPRFPMASSSQLPLRHPGKIEYAPIQRHPAMHDVLPRRFVPALSAASILLKSGEVLS